MKNRRLIGVARPRGQRGGRGRRDDRWGGGIGRSAGGRGIIDARVGRELARWRLPFFKEDHSQLHSPKPCPEPCWLFLLYMVENPWAPGAQGF